MRIRKILVFLSLSLVLCVSLGMVSAADLSVNDISDDFVLTGDISSIGISDSIVNYKSQFNDMISGNGASKNESNNSGFISCNVSCENDFKNVHKQFKNLTNNSIGIIINIINNINITHEGSVLDFGCKNKTLVIFGNGFNISVRKPDLRCENHFLNCDDSSMVLMCDIVVSGFNTALITYGKCILENVTFESNRLNYWIHEDYGGAIKNFGDLECYNCSFVNNLAKYGGAIYSNDTFSNVKLSDCIFKKNTAYGGDEKGNDVFVGGDELVSVYNLNKESTSFSSIQFGYDDSPPIFINRTSYDPIVREYVVNDKYSLKNASTDMWHSYGDVDIFVVNVTKDVDFTAWDKNMHAFHPHYGLLIINGNGYKIHLQGAKEDEEYHFAYVNKTSLLVNGLSISGFNCAVMNYGICEFCNCCFLNNHVKYSFFSGDEAGAINNHGLLYCTNCTFQGNKGNLAGVIYSANHAIVNLNNCFFIDNIPCKCAEGADLYNYNYATYIIDGLEISKDSNLTNITMSYDYIPDTWSLKNIMFNILKTGSYILACGVTFVVSCVSILIAGPAGAVTTGYVSLGLGTALGTVIDLVADAWFSNSIHEFKGFSIYTIVHSLFFHYLQSYLGLKWV